MTYKAFETCQWGGVLKDIRKFEQEGYWGDPTPNWVKVLADEMDSGIYNPEVLSAAKNWVIDRMDEVIDVLYAERLEYID